MKKTGKQIIAQIAGMLETLDDDLIASIANQVLPDKVEALGYDDFEVTIGGNAV